MYLNVTPKESRAFYVIMKSPQNQLHIHSNFMNGSNFLLLLSPHSLSNTYNDGVGEKSAGRQALFPPFLCFIFLIILNFETRPTSKIGRKLTQRKLDISYVQFERRIEKMAKKERDQAALYSSYFVLFSGLLLLFIVSRRLVLY